MRKLVTIVALGVILVAASPIEAPAHPAAAAALALGAFATFGLLATAPLWAAPYPVYAYPAPVYEPPAYYAPAPAYAPSLAPAIQREVIYPHGRHVLYGDGVSTAYQWVWVPNAPPPPPPPGAPPGR